MCLEYGCGYSVRNLCGQSLSSRGSCQRGFRTHEPPVEPGRWLALPQASCICNAHVPSSFAPSSPRFPPPSRHHPRRFPFSPLARFLSFPLAFSSSYSLLCPLPGLANLDLYLGLRRPGKPVVYNNPQGWTTGAVSPSKKHRSSCPP